jgi:hypothetical protein
MKAILNSPDADAVLTGLVEGAVNTSGVKNWGDAKTLARAYDYARQGLYSAIGETDYQQLTDQAGLTTLQYNLQDRNNARQHARAVAEKKRQEAVAAAADTGNTTHSRLSPLALRSPQELSNRKRQIDRWMTAGYFKKDSKGNYRMTHAGFEAMRRGARNVKKETKETWWDPVTGLTPSQMRRGNPNERDFYTFMVNLNGGKSFLNDDTGQTVKSGWGPGRAGNLFKQYESQSQLGSYDTYHSTEYDRQLPSEYGKEVTKQLWSASGTQKGHNVLIPVEFNGRNGWKEGKGLNAEELAGYTATNVRYSKWGNTAILQKDGADPIRVKIPPGIHLASESRVSSAIGNADDWSLILDKGLQPKTKIAANGALMLDRDREGNIKFTNTPLTDVDRTVFVGFQQDALDDMNTYGSQLFVGSKTKDEEYGNINY